MFSAGTLVCGLTLYFLSIAQNGSAGASHSDAGGRNAAKGRSEAHGYNGNNGGEASKVGILLNHLEICLNSG